MFTTMKHFSIDLEERLKSAYSFTSLLWLTRSNPFAKPV